MVKKLVLSIGSCTNEHKYDHNFLLETNNNLQGKVKAFKNKITEYYQNKLWDKYKKISNEFELIFTSPHTQHNISGYSPVSRSFFKLWEIIHDFEDAILKPDTMKVVFLAEGPGGFMEAWGHKRNYRDKMYGITLKSSNNRNVPDWKFIHENVSLSYGKDGTGNLCNIDNIVHFSRTVGENSVDFITADGGFDFSSDFNGQEELSFQLIMSEVLSCLLLLKQDGSFLIKIYDCFNLTTIRLLAVLNETFTGMHFIKPLTSRPANSERYVLCTGFKGRANDAVKRYVSILSFKIKEYTIQNYPNILDEVILKDTFLFNIVLYNLYYSIRQIYYIQRTINYINYFRTSNNDAVMNSIIEHHSKKSRRWCEIYHIPQRSLE
jgi:23S rRNA U2552 (ribose-2'-O)-methylase RlmE/FtsJ